MELKKNIFSKLFIITIAIVIAAMALLFLKIFNKNSNLVIYDENNTVISKHGITKNGTFSISFIHSVNKSPVTDYYQIKGTDIYLYKTVYYNYGAGVPTDIEGYETLSYGEDGSMIIDNINKKIDDLKLFLSEQSDHTLTIMSKEIFSLWDECGKKITITIKIEE